LGIRAAKVDGMDSHFLGDGLTLSLNHNPNRHPQKLGQLNHTVGCDGWMRAKKPHRAQVAVWLKLPQGTIKTAW